MRGKDLSTKQRNSFVQFVLESSKDDKLARGKFSEAAANFDVYRQTVFRLWTTAMKQKKNEGCINSISKKKTKAKRIIVQLNLENIRRLPLRKRYTIRSLAAAINCKKSTVGKWVAQGLIKAHTSAIKPTLSASNMLQRLRFSLDTIESDTQLNKLMFKTMHNTVHIDEKWFYITKSNRRFYLTPGEAEPHRTCQSKRFIGKVMFMCAVARPIFNADGSVLLDGKIGIFPFTEMVPAKRSSKNRVAGTMELKPISSITMPVIKNNLITQLVPAIKSVWPEDASKLIYIQQDNARPHIKDSDLDFRAIASSDGFDIRLVNQPPKSPDFNINDLGWFRAILSLQYQTDCLNTNDLANAVVESFNQLDATKLNNVFLTLQSCMLEVMKLKGLNSYRIPHMKKEALARADLLPLTLEAPKDLVKECIDHLKAKGAVDGIEDLKLQLGVYQTAGA